ncbi:unnamed protein product [Mesocestoides corti]|uniref:Uncharacterized protein n=2 Tax=Mesocestoides corti TaxID=53468 RepID=A0A0R3UAN1_MESCO|nr:unnamed protein product [Mesocestoides corti]
MVREMASQVLESWHQVPDGREATIKKVSQSGPMVFISQHRNVSHYEIFQLLTPSSRIVLPTNFIALDTELIAVKTSEYHLTTTINQNAPARRFERPASSIRSPAFP